MAKAIMTVHLVMNDSVRQPR